MAPAAHAAVLADFGSTFTKVSLVELETGRLLARAQAPTSVTTDVLNGYRTALDRALAEAGPSVVVGPRLAASSAAGGLRVAAIGLVEDLTAAAARQAALNAGARIELLLHGRLDATSQESLRRVAPEVVLVSGGTDGGQERIVLDNAEVLAAAEVEAHFVVACNERVGERVAAVLARTGSRVDVVANVMPRIGTLEVEPARKAISEAFVNHVIKGKGLSTSDEFASQVVMPTPEAVLRATHLYAIGAPELDGAGDVLVVDVGGATTDVHSSSQQSDPGPGVRGPLLPVTPIRRTVQGDLGLRSNAPSVLANDRGWQLARLAELSIDVAAAEYAVARRAESPELVASTREDWDVDRTLAIGCIHQALRRHCGRLTISQRPNQPARISANGPDLRAVPIVIGTGGILVRSPDAVGILQEALDRCDDRSLTPRTPRLAIDTDYLLAAAGLLAEVDPRAAYRLMRARIHSETAGHGSDTRIV